jgi:hypothetical protein
MMTDIIAVDLDGIKAAITRPAFRRRGNMPGPRVNDTLRQDT